MSSDCDLKALKRVVKICSFVKRMMRDGKEIDFRLMNGAGEEKESFADKESQVIVAELEANVEPAEELSVEEQPISPADALFNLLKKHAIDVLTRAARRPKGYYAVIWEDLTLEQLLEYRLEQVFKDSQDLQDNERGPGATFAEYLDQVLNSL